MKKIFFILIVSFLLSSPCLAGEWNLTGSPNQGREGAPSGIFDNGDVMICGGIANCIVLSSCEIYDPMTEQWSEADSMTFGRRDFPLVKFKHNGINEFLAASGTQSLVAEIFNPQSQIWYETGSMHYWRLEASAIAFPDPENDENDLVLFIGGDVQNDYRSCEIYNPATGLFSMTGFLVEGKCGAKLVYNQNLNIIMAIGGWGSSGMTSLYDCEIYDIATGIWTQIASTNYPHEHHTANYHKEEETILVVGSSYAPHNACEVYDFATGIWTPIDTLEIGRWNHCSKTLLNTKTLVIGGLPGWANMSCETYNHETNQWQTVASTYYPHYNFSTEILKDERVLAIKSWCEIYTWNYMPIVSPPQTLSGLNEAIVGEILTLSVTATDPDGDSVSVRIDWGDDEFTEWSELVASGSTLEFSHSWTETGTYQVRAQSADQWFFLNPLCHNSISEWSEPTVITITETGVEPDPNSPEPILCVYPNPFKTSTTISISFSNIALVRPVQTEISVFNIKGQIVKTWSLQTTSQQVVWNGKDDNGKNITSGIYFCKYRLGGLSSTKKLILLK